jgi:hypothetical protein
MTDEDEERYEDLRHFITNSGTPERGARYLLGLEEEMNEVAPPKSDSERIDRECAKTRYHAIINPSPLATDEQIEFCCRTKEQMEKLRAMRDTGWKTPSEEGYEAFDPRAQPVDWDGKMNPYPSGTKDYEEWDEGYGDAVMNSLAELADAFEAEKDQIRAEEECQIMQSSLEKFFDRTEDTAKSSTMTFLGLSAINLRMSMLGGVLTWLDLEIGYCLPADVHGQLSRLIEELRNEGQNVEIERIGCIEDRLSDFKRILIQLKALGVEIAARSIMTPFGTITDDLYHFWYVMHSEANQAAREQNWRNQFAE